MNTIQLNLRNSATRRTQSATFSQNSRDADAFPPSEGLPVTADLVIRAIRGEALPKGWFEIARQDGRYEQTLRLLSAKRLLASVTVELVGGLYSGGGESRACASVPLHECLMSGEVCGVNPSFGREAQDWVDVHQNAIEKRLIRSAKIVPANWRWLAQGDFTEIAEVQLPLFGGNFHEARAYIALTQDYREED